MVRRAGERDGLEKGVEWAVDGGESSVSLKSRDDDLLLGDLLNDRMEERRLSMS